MATLFTDVGGKVRPEVRLRDGITSWNGVPILLCGHCGSVPDFRYQATLAGHRDKASVECCCGAAAQGTDPAAVVNRWNAIQRETKQWSREDRECPHCLGGVAVCGSDQRDIELTCSNAECTYCTVSPNLQATWKAWGAAKVQEQKESPPRCPRCNADPELVADVDNDVTFRYHVRCSNRCTGRNGKKLIHTNWRTSKKEAWDAWHHRVGAGGQQKQKKPSTSTGTAPQCPQCGRRVRAAHSRVKTLVTTGKPNPNYDRPYEACDCSYFRWTAARGNKEEASSMRKVGHVKKMKKTKPDLLSHRVWRCGRCSYETITKACPKQCSSCNHTKFYNRGKPKPLPCRCGGKPRLKVEDPGLYYECCACYDYVESMDDAAIGAGWSWAEALHEWDYWATKKKDYTTCVECGRKYLKAVPPRRCQCGGLLGPGTPLTKTTKEDNTPSIFVCSSCGSNNTKVDGYGNTECSACGHLKDNKLFSTKEDRTKEDNPVGKMYRCTYCYSTHQFGDHVGQLSCKHCGRTAFTEVDQKPTEKDKDMNDISQTFTKTNDKAVKAIKAGANQAIGCSAEKAIMGQFQKLLGDQFPTEFYATPLGEALLDGSVCYAVLMATGMFPEMPASTEVGDYAQSALVGVSAKSFAPMMALAQQMIADLADQAKLAGLNPTNNNEE